MKREHGEDKQRATSRFEPSFSNSLSILAPLRASSGLSNVCKFNYLCLNRPKTQGRSSIACFTAPPLPLPLNYDGGMNWGNSLLKMVSIDAPKRLMLSLLHYNLQGYPSWKMGDAQIDDKNAGAKIKIR